MVAPHCRKDTLQTQECKTQKKNNGICFVFVITMVAVVLVLAAWTLFKITNYWNLKSTRPFYVMFYDRFWIISILISLHPGKYRLVGQFANVLFYDYYEQFKSRPIYTISRWRWRWMCNEHWIPHRIALYSRLMWQMGPSDCSLFGFYCHGGECAVFFECETVHISMAFCKRRVCRIEQKSRLCLISRCW